MIQILYRGKRIDNGEWVEGNLYEAKISGCYILVSYMKTSERNRFLMEDAFTVYEIDPKTLCQYICLNDKKLHRIWENDIISINTYDYNEPAEDFFGQVVYVEAWACWCIKQPGENKPIPLCECQGSYLTEITVEGNIFDNPEMMEVN